MTTANPCRPETFTAHHINAAQPMEMAIKYLANAWRAWRKHQLERATWRTLNGLSDATRRDLGLAERCL